MQAACSSDPARRLHAAARHDAARLGPASSHWDVGSFLSEGPPPSCLLKLGWVFILYLCSCSFLVQEEVFICITTKAISLATVHYFKLLIILVLIWTIAQLCFFCRCKILVLICIFRKDVTLLFFPLPTSQLLFELLAYPCSLPCVSLPHAGGCLDKKKGMSGSCISVFCFLSSQPPLEIPFSTWTKLLCDNVS